ncbi:MAG TPA: GNAT family N-acetyltransferase [Steroidobacteraceae bacterium]|nr:GNAT family N-acetyltransferase [Steroidobacteraceae bacterium]
MIRRVANEDLERVRGFLEAHVETSLFLLSNLALFGPTLGDHPNSGNYYLMEQDGRVVAVFCVSRRGYVLAQSGGRPALAPAIYRVCAGEPVEMCGVVAEWPLAEALWRLLAREPGFVPGMSSKDVLYRRSLAADLCESNALPGGLVVRGLHPSDYPQWQRLNSAYLSELHLPIPVADSAHELEFAWRARSRWWWGAFSGSRLAATVALNAAYGTIGQVGGVYTRPADRRKGFARAAMLLLMEECRERHGFEHLILFTGEGNHGARRLYESLGFVVAGAFGLMTGSPRQGERPTPSRAQ